MASATSSDAARSSSCQLSHVEASTTAEVARADALHACALALQEEHPPSASAKAKAAKAKATALLDRIVGASVEGGKDAGAFLRGLPERERKAVAGALACVSVGLHGDAEAASAFVTVAVVDLLGLDPNHVDALEPLARPVPETLDDLAGRQEMAAASFVRAEGTDGGATVDDDAWTRERWTLIVGALMIGAVASKAYTANASAALQRLAAAAGVDWLEISALEDALAAHLKEMLTRETKEKKKRGSALWPSSLATSSSGRDDANGLSSRFTRAASVGTAAVVGGGLLFLTGGMAAPAVVASLASIGAAGGVIGAAALYTGAWIAYFGGAAGISVLFGSVGAGLAGWRMARRTSGLSQFAFLPVRGSSAGLSVYLFVPGFLRDPADLFRTWGATDGVYSVVIDLPPNRVSPRGDNRAETPVKEDPEWGAEVRGAGMWVRRDPATGDVMVSWVEPGGAAERAGIAEGSVLTAVAGGAHPDRPRRVRGNGDDGDDPHLLGLSQVRAILAGRERSEGTDAAQKTSNAVELWLRRNLSAGADVEKVALRRRPKLRLWRSKKDKRARKHAAAFKSSGEETSAALAAAGTTAKEATNGRGRTEGTVDDEAKAEVKTKEEVGGEEMSGEDEEEAECSDDDEDDEDEDEDDDALDDSDDSDRASETSEREMTTFRKSSDIDRKDAACGCSDESEDEPSAPAKSTSGTSSSRSVFPSLASAFSFGASSREPSPALRDAPPVTEEVSAAVAAAAMAEQWPLPYGEQHVLGWEHALLMDLGGAMSSFGHSAVAGYVGGKVLAHTFLAGIAAAVAWPATLLNSASFIDSPWALLESRSKAAGEQLAAALLEKRQGLRPVTLVGYSLGAMVIKHAASALDAAADGKGKGIIQDVVLVGAPLDTSAESWDSLRRVAAGRVVNCCMAAGGDWMLQFVYRTNTMVVRHGLSAWSEVKHQGVENVDVSDVCSGHMNIPDDMPRILAKVGLA